MEQLSLRQELLSQVLNFENEDGKFDYLIGELERIANKLPYSKNEEYYKAKDSRVGTMDDKLESFSFGIMDFSKPTAPPEYLNDEGQGSFNKHIQNKLKAEAEARCAGKKGTQAANKAVLDFIYFQDDWNK